MIAGEGTGSVQFHIDRPNAELTEGYFIIGLKYTVLFIIGWLISWALLIYMLSGRRKRSSGLLDVVVEHAWVTSIALALGVVWFLGRRALRKRKLGLITSMEFDDENGMLSLNLLNTITGGQVLKTIDYEGLRISLSIVHDKLFGKQRIFEIHENGELVNRLNVDLTAWCRHEQVEVIVHRLESFSGRNVPRN